MSQSALLLEESWDTLRSQIDSRLASYVPQPPDCPPQLREAMSYSLLAEGKRLRPVLVLLACEACGGDPERALPAACAVEMVHTYSLIHDDLPSMDDDDTRRGRPSNHVQFGEATAILAGDALLTLAFEVLTAEIRPAEVAAACCADLAAAAGATGMVGGQVADLEAENATNLSVAQLEAIHRRKTGCLFRSSLRMGARIALADSETLDAIDTYGKHIGLAFQIADDLLDLSGNEQKMGKPARKDAHHGKSTYPSLLGVTESRQLAEDLIDRARDAIAPLGERSLQLDQLAQFILQRDH